MTLMYAVILNCLSVLFFVSCTSLRTSTSLSLSVFAVFPGAGVSPDKLLAYLGSLEIASL